MKTMIKLICLLLVILAGIIIYLFNANPSALTKKILQPVVEYQCGKELEESKVWKTAVLFMNEEQQKKNLNTICACVGDHATNDVTVKEVFTAYFDEKEKDKLVSKAVVNSIRGCAEEALLKKP